MARKEKATEAAPMEETCCKDNEYRAQRKIIFQSFLERPKTMLDVSLGTGILRANICRYVADMEDKGLIQLLYRAEDEHTKCTAGYYTTDKKLFRKDNNQQLDLWRANNGRG